MNKESSGRSVNLSEFDGIIDEISMKISSQENFVSDEYKVIFLRFMDLIRISARYDIALAKALLKNLIEASIVLLVEKEKEDFSIKIVKE